MPSRFSFVAQSCAGRIARVAALVLMLGGGAARLAAFNDVATNLTDQQFFGYMNGAIWTPGVIDYAYSSALTPVQQAAQAGDYATAKTALLTYYQNRTMRTVPVITSSLTAGQSLTGQLVSPSNFIFSSAAGEYPQAVVTVNVAQSTVSANVTDAVKDSSKNAYGLIGFMLMGKTFNLYASFRSGNNPSNRPALIITTSDSVQHTYYPTADTTVRAGPTYGNTNYGTSTLLEVKEMTAPTNTTTLMSDFERRAFLSFDFSALTGTVTSAVLQLTGSATVDNTPVVVFKSRLVPETATWNSLGPTWTTFSWQGTSGGNLWVKPAEADSEFNFINVRFGFGSRLVSLYLANPADPTYASALLTLMLDFISDQGNANVIYPRSLDGALRAVSWVQQYHHIRGASAMDANANSALLKNLWGIGNALTLASNYHPTNNWGTFESQALYNLAVYFPEFSAAAAWQSLAQSRLDSQMGTLLLADASYNEASSLYTVGALNTFAAIKNFGEMNAQTFTSTYDTKLQGLATYVMDMSAPDGFDPVMADADRADNKVPMKALTTAYPARADFQYFSTGGTLGTRPSYGSKLYPNQMYAFMRTGWTPQDAYAGVDLNSGSHEHPDLLNLHAFAYGQPLLQNPGRYSYDAAGLSAIADFCRRRTLSKNSVEVDGVGQPLLAGATGGRAIAYWASNDLFDFFEGKHSAKPGVQHTRRVFFLKPHKFWVVNDGLWPSDGQSHAYNLTWHPPIFGATASPFLTLNPTTGAALATLDGGVSLAVVPLSISGVTASVQTNGYYSPRFGVALPTNYLSYARTSTANTYFDTVLYPFSGTPGTVTTSFLTMNPSSTPGTPMRIGLGFLAAGEVGDYYAYRGTGTPVSMTYGNYSHNGKLAYVQSNTAGYRHLVLVNGNFLSTAPVALDLITSPTNIADIGVTYNGTTLEIFGAKLVPSTNAAVAIEIYAPVTMQTVKLNGTAVAFTQTGNYLYAAKTQ